MRNITIRIFSILLFFFVLLPCLADEPASSKSLDSFIRYSKSQGQLETAVVRYQNSKGQLLDLYSAVHVGSSTYYKTLNENFAKYDAVLYELILPDEMAGTKLPSHLKTDSGVSGLQGFMARSMGLVTQMDRIDYSPDNFIHADLTQSGLSQKMASRQESLMTYFSKAMANSQSVKSQDLGVTDQELAQFNLMAVLNGQTSTTDKRILRKLFAGALSSSGGVLSALGDSALISERNKAALTVLEREARSGKGKMALYYGAAHMPDLERRLGEMGWSRVKTDWLKAWSI